MDPNATLRCLRALIKDAFADSRFDYARVDRDELARRHQDIAGKLDSLDHWLTCGGCLPKDWGTRK